MTMSDDNRYPKSVFGVGGEPDPRFTLANERTFLSWIRTALAIIAAGVAIEELQVGNNPILRTLAALLMILGGAVMAVYAFYRWKKSERAMREQKPLPAFKAGAVVSGLTAVAAIAVVLLLLI
jgi:putative membrane protein